MVLLQAYWPFIAPRDGRDRQGAMMMSATTCPRGLKSKLHLPKPPQNTFKYVSE